MKYDKESYLKEVLKGIHTDRKTKKRNKKDLGIRIDDGYKEDPFFDLVIEMGEPSLVAEDFMENLDVIYPDLPFVIQQMVPYEYRSKANIFGLPLVHIHTGGAKNNSVAKGVLAIGDIAIGLVSIGGVSFGLISIGGVAIGAASLGGVAIGAFAGGGVAIGLYAAGAVAISLLKGIGAVSLVMFK